MSGADSRRGLQIREDQEELATERVNGLWEQSFQHKEVFVNMGDYTL